jgi:uncharacterized protein YukJ
MATLKLVCATCSAGSDTTPGRRPVPMAITTYGALRGQFDFAKREDDESSPHLHLRVLAGNTPWRVAVNVQSHDNSDVVYWIVDPIANHPIRNTVAGLPPGFTEVDEDAAHALDFATGRTLLPSGHASADDLQDLLLLHLSQLKAAGGDLVAFGARFDQNLHKKIDKEFGNTSGRNGIHAVNRCCSRPTATESRAKTLARKALTSASDPQRAIAPDGQRWKAEIFDFSPSRPRWYPHCSRDHERRLRGVSNATVVTRDPNTIAVSGNDHDCYTKPDQTAANA